MKPEDILNNYQAKVKDATPESVLAGERDTLRKAEGAKPLQKVLGKVKLAYEFVRDSMSGVYTDYSKASLAIIVGGLAYLALPIDLVPDFIPLVGWLDDVVVLTWVFAQTAVELEKYEDFRNARKQLTNGDDDE